LLVMAKHSWHHCLCQINWLMYFHLTVCELSVSSSTLPTSNTQTDPMEKDKSMPRFPTSYSMRDVEYLVHSEELSLPIYSMARSSTLSSHELPLLCATVRSSKDPIALTYISCMGMYSASRVYQSKMHRLSSLWFTVFIKQ
jgi:hypothetical protein